MSVSKKKSQIKEPWRYLTLFITPIVLIVIAFGGALYLQQRSADRHSLLSTVQNKVNSTYSNIAINDSPWPAQMGSGVSVAASGYDFQLNSQSLPSMYFTMKDGHFTAMTSSRTANSPHAIVSPIIDTTITRAGYIAYIGKQNIITYINDYDNKCLSIFDQNQTVLTLTCYTKEDTNAAAAKIQPFVAAYTKSNQNTDSSSTTYGPATIKSQNKSGVITSSFAPGYDIAEAVIQNGTRKQLALFYSKDGGAWHYITQADDEYGFSCSAYTANPDVRKAMYDQICLSDQGQVRLDTNNRALQ